MTGVSFTVRSPAKINWCLRVLGRRADGFHDIASLVSAISLYDDLVFTDRGRAGIEVTCVGADLPSDERNLIVRAGRLLAEAAGCPPRASCHLVKRIPIGGGLGGGSSDGAAALLALNRLWGLNWPLERIAPLAARLGSDVSFFLYGGTAVMSGRGERITPVSIPWDGWLVLLLPAFSTSTAEVYRAWQPPHGPVAPTLMDEIMAGASSPPVDAEQWLRAAYNMLEEPLLRVCPAIGPLIDAGCRLAGRPVRVSGSGSTLFTAFGARGQAEEFARRARQETGIEARVVRVVQDRPALEIRAAETGGRREHERG